MGHEGRERADSRLRWLIAAGACLAVAGLVVFLLSRSAGVQAQQQAAAPPPPPVTVSKPLKKQVVEWEEFSGQFAPVEYVEMRARVNGYLTEIHFTDGQIVKKGDLLFVIDPRPYEDALAIAKAQVAQAEATLDLAKRQLNRGADLVKKEFLAQSDYDSRDQQVKSAQAQLDSAHAQVRDAEINLEFTHVTAPVSGRVGAHQVSIGNLISGGGNGAQATLLTTIVSLDPVWFNFDISEADYLALERATAAGQLAEGRGGKIPVELRLTDETAWKRKGTLDFIDNQIDRGAGTIRARATVPNPDLFITPGAFGRLRLPGGAMHEVLLVPDAAIVTDQSLAMLMVVGDDGVVAARHVVTGPIVDGLRVIREGIGGDDRVIINGLLRARPGGHVTAQPGTIAPPQG